MDRKVRATLTQSVDQLMSILIPQVVHLYNDVNVEHFALQVDIQDFVWWLVCRHIEDCYLLRVTNFNYRSVPHETLYYALSSNVPSLNVLISQFIRAPNIYQDNEIEVFLDGREVRIFYYARERDPQVFVRTR